MYFWLTGTIFKVLLLDCPAWADTGFFYTNIFKENCYER